MISVETARKQLRCAVPMGDPASVPIAEAVGCMLADDIASLADLPRFDNSAMDGYAVRASNTTKAHPDHPAILSVVETISAGQPSARVLGPGEAAQIMTGAKIPDGATAVVPQEEVLADERTVYLQHPAKEGAHIRRCGEELRVGDRALTQGTMITPGAVGLLAALGEREVPVFPPPRVTVLSTGSELVTDKKELTEGKIFETNTTTLCAALAELGIVPTTQTPVADSEAALRPILEWALHTSDVVIITGGISAGKYDLVKTLLAEQQVETVFWKVAQKPGKPFYFGRRLDTLVFGLPGNPASSLVCYYEYVRAAILQWMGFRDSWLPEETVRLASAITKKGGRTHFVRAVTTNVDGQLRVTPLSEQGSHCMQSFALANCLLVLPADLQEFAEESLVTIHWLPQHRGGGV